MTPLWLSAADVEKRLSPGAAVDALEAALRAGLDPEADVPRAVVDFDAGQLLVMPSAATPGPVVKLVTVGGDPRIQGLCVVFDPDTLAPAALVDGIAVTKPAHRGRVRPRRPAPRPPGRPTPARLRPGPAGPRARCPCGPSAPSSTSPSLGETTHERRDQPQSPRAHPYRAGAAPGLCRVGQGPATSVRSSVVV